MANLILNRIKFELKIPETGIELYCYKSEALFRLKYKYFVEKLESPQELYNFKKFFGNYDVTNINDQLYVYFSFQKSGSNNYFTFKINEANFQSFKKQFVKELLIEYFKSKGFLIEPYSVGVDLRLYVFTEDFNKEWSKYARYDFIIKRSRSEIIFNKTSENVLLSKEPIIKNLFQDIEFTELKAIDPKTNYIKKVKYIKQDSVRVMANNEIKKQISLSVSPKKPSYKSLYNDLKEFYSKYLLDFKNDFFNIQQGDFVHVNNNDLNRVYKEKNVMVFKDGKTDINAATGMRDYGPFKLSPKAKDVQFIFIYENSDDANKLYGYFKSGFRHFPGLQTYIGIPPTRAGDLVLKYKKESLRKDFDTLLKEKLPEQDYGNYFVIFIGPFKKNYTSDDFKEPDLYYYIKKELLQKGISSQFIYYQSIRSDNFHYYLPNIAVAILAKLGGIPWRLKEQYYKELIIGFNIKRINNTQYIGSSVFFDNEGYLSSVNSYEGGNLDEIINHLKKTIEYYRISNQDEELKRIIIHNYKPYGKREQKIEELLHKELKLDVPFIYIEINESKTTTEVCFDEDYDYGMPVSGTYVKAGINEYLLFNNTRYIEKPMRAINEEWPIKLRIYSDPKINFDEKQLISQVYEFSRLYWKSLKQKSQPVTTIYSKLIADYRGNFDEPIPNNKIAEKTPWFL